MAGTSKRITFLVTPEIEKLLDTAKKDYYYKQTKSDMIRELVRAGLRSLVSEKVNDNT